MRISAMGLELIREMEGLRLSPYRVGSGKLTAGYGHELSEEEKRRSWPIDKQQAERWLQDDVMIAEKCLDETIDAPLQQHEWEALVSFVYNVGGGGFRKSTLRKRINARDNEGAAKEFERWIYAKHEVLTGLIVRRKIGGIRSICAWYVLCSKATFFSRCHSSRLSNRCFYLNCSKRLGL